MSHSPVSDPVPASVQETFHDEGLDANEVEAIWNTYRNAAAAAPSPTSPVMPRYRETTQRSVSARTSDADFSLHRTRSHSARMDEHTGLLAPRERQQRAYRAISSPGQPRRPISRMQSSVNSIRAGRSRRSSLVRKFAKALGTDANQTGPRDPGAAQQAQYYDDRVWYDQFTSTDWVYDSIKNARRAQGLKSRKDFAGRLRAFLDGGQGWLLSAVIGCLTAGFAYFIDITESSIFDLKSGFCSRGWWFSKSTCCAGASICDEWTRWSGLVGATGPNVVWVDFTAYVLWVLVLAILACLVTLQTKTTISSAMSLATLDENLGADRHHDDPDHRSKRSDRSMSPISRFRAAARRPPVVYYPAAGSGVAEVRVILSGFVLHGYLGVKTLFTKSIALILSVASGLSLGKEGPYVHIATCIGNIACRMSSKYLDNDGNRREIMSAAAAAGVAVAFGAPIGGVLFSLEEVSYYFPRKTLFRTFFCTIVAALSLKFLNPYGTNKIVLFEVRYLTDWKFFEIGIFCLIGVLGGVLGAIFIKASKFWAQQFRSLTYVKQYPVLEVFIVAIVTGLVSFWNRYTRLPVAELLYELAAPCDAFSAHGETLCPTEERIGSVIKTLSIAFIIKAVLTTITFGIKVPAGIYVPSMVVGGFLGRIIGHAMQALALAHPERFGCPADGDPESCVVPGVYALVAAGATMCGVTRLSVTLAVILFEMTGSLAYVLPFSLGVLIAKWTADALEPSSIYDLLTDMNAYPYLDSKVRPIFTTDLGDLTPSPNPNRSIDISNSSLVPARQLRSKLEYMHMSGELDGGLPVVRDDILVGLIPGPALEFGLDKLTNESRDLCLMDPHQDWVAQHDKPSGEGYVGSNNSSVIIDRNGSNDDDDDDDDNDDDVRIRGSNNMATAEASHLINPTIKPVDPTDFTAYIDPAPMTLDICSSMDLVFECFVKLGLRYICVVREGKYVGLVHKKTFVRYVKSLQEG